MKKSRIGILTGGGDCAGLNPAIKWVVKTATDDRLQAERGVQYEVIGIRDGWQGLVQADPSHGDSQEWLVPLDQHTVRTWDRFGGTMLGTSRTNPYNPKNDQSKTVLENIEKLRLDALVAIGGDDTLGVASKLALEGVKVVGIPKTIDRDLWGTDYTLGFEIGPERDRGRNRPAAHHGRLAQEDIRGGDHGEDGGVAGPGRRRIRGRLHHPHT